MVGNQARSVPGGGAVDSGERWISTDTWCFVTFALGFLLEAYIFGMAAIATGWVKMPTSLRSLLLSWAPLWLIIGIAVAGPLADRVGRKTTFYLTMALYGVGVIGIVFSSTYFLILFFLAIMLFAAGGEMNTIMAASHEVMPTRHRGKTMFFELNFINLGGVLLASISMLTAYQNVAFQRGMIAVLFVVVLFALFLARLRTPESIRWLEGRGATERARREAEKYYGAEQWAARQEAAAQANPDTLAIATRHVGDGLKYFTSITIAFAGAAGFGLMTYVLGPAHFPKYTATIILVATLVGFVSGLILAAVADRFSRRWLLFIGYLGSFVITLLIAVAVPAWSADLAFFWVLLVVLNLFVNIGYLTEDTLKSEVWPTKVRATRTAIVRFVSIAGYIATIYITQSFSLTQYAYFSALIWAIGFAGALAWFASGTETGKGLSLEVASGE